MGPALRSGYALPSVRPHRRSHPDCRWILILIVARHPWLAKLLAAKPRKVVAVALANKMARIGWALMTRQEDYRDAHAAA